MGKRGPRSEEAMLRRQARKHVPDGKSEVSRFFESIAGSGSQDADRHIENAKEHGVGAAWKSSSSSRVDDCPGGGGGFVCYDPPSHCKPLSCLIPNACDRSESSILELGARKEEIQNEEPLPKRLKVDVAQKEDHLKDADDDSDPPSETEEDKSDDTRQIASQEKILEPAKKRQKRRSSKKDKLVKSEDDETERGQEEYLQIRKNGIAFMLANIRSVKNPLNAGRLSAQLKESRPDVIFLTETWLDESVQEVNIPGYRSIARRDRGTRKKGGGVDILVRNSFRDAGLLSISESSERSWVTLHTEQGPILLGVWYRPPDESRELLETLAAELEQHSPGHIGIFLLCDANIHHKRWLKFSESNSSLGQELQEICDGAGLVQIVREPTRKKNLLDLVLTTMPDICRTTVLASLTDHRAVLCEVQLKAPEIVESTREVWNFRDADWNGLKSALRSQSWEFLRAGSASDGAQELTSAILKTAKAFIPKRILREQKSTHPWITSRCEESIEEKNRIEKELQQSTSSGRHEQGEIEDLEERFKRATERSNGVLGQAYEAYIMKIREEIQTLPNHF